MKTLVGLAVAAALSVGAAHASIVMPGTGTGELIEWVVDTNTNNVYARGIGVSESAILPASSIQSAATYNSANAPVSTGTSLPTIGPDANLTTFLAQGSGHDSFQFGIIAAGQATGGAAGVNPGGNVFQFSSGNTIAASNLNPPLSSVIPLLLLDVQNDVTTLNSLIGGTPGDTGSAVVAGNFPTSSNVFNVYTLNDPLMSDLGTSVNLYSYTGDGAKTKPAQAYTAGLITMTANGTLEAVAGSTPPPVPLPAAIWLFGSGLLGFFGVGRRRAA
jgi:hypothetical protein